MKKILLIAALAATSLSMSAQSKLSLSTYSGTDIAKYDGKVMDVTVSRYVFTGWNTISLPFDVTEAQLNEVFGQNCRLETLVGVENDGADLKLNFKDAKGEGLKANTPYILYYTGENASKTFVAKEAKVIKGDAKIAFTSQSGETVTFATAHKQTQSAGLYGILAKDNGEATFVNVNDATNGFYATRCYIELSNGNSQMLKTNHIGANDVTSIKQIVKGNEKVDVYSIGGTKVASKVTSDAINALNPGVYVIKGKKILVK